MTTAQSVKESIDLNQPGAEEKYAVLFVSGSLHLSGATFWLNELIESCQELGVVCAHVIIGRKRVIQSTAHNQYLTGQAKKRFSYRLVRAFKVHKFWPALYERLENLFYNRILHRVLDGKLAEKVLLIKDFSAPLPSYFSDERFKVVAVLHHQHEKFVASPPATLVAVSQTIQKNSTDLGFLVSGVIYNPLNKKRILQRAREFVPKEEKYIVFVGRLIQAKGVMELLDAYIRLHGAGTIRHKLVFVGSGRCSKELAARAKRHGLAEQVVLKGFQDNPYPYIKHAQLLVLPSYSEAMGYAAVEAAVLGTNYLVSDYPAAVEFFPQDNMFSMGKNREEFINNLAAKIIALLEQPQAELKEGILAAMEPGKVAGQYLRLGEN